MKRIPVLISRSFVAFPNVPIQLEIGRAKSIIAIASSIEFCDSHLIVVAQKSCDLDNPTHKDIYSIGTLSQIEIIKKHPDESLTIVVKGVKRVLVSELDIEFPPITPNKEFLKTIARATKLEPKSTTDDQADGVGKMWMADYEVLKEKNISFLKGKHLIHNLLGHIEDIVDKESAEFKAVKELAHSFKPDCGLVVDSIASLWPYELDVSDVKQRCLEELNVSERIRIILEEDMEISEQAKESINENINKKVNKNISKQQKDFYLREKIRVIKEELGESYSKANGIQNIKKWLKTTAAPKNIKDKVKEELIKLECSPSMSNENVVIKTYIDWIMDLPWFEYTEDEVDFDQIQKSLDQKHCGLEKVKERIIEFIATQRKTQHPSGTIICLVGPPGVGKTSLAHAIADALNKKYVKVELGGLNDEAEIRGHRRTYVGSMPGKIIKALKSAKCNNPLILLDEIDKITCSCNGDPSSALLEVLDPKHNSNFSDNYIEEGVDLSKVMFIATANYEENIPDPLLNRMEIINLTSYTEKEKLFIAKSNLIDEVLKEHGLDRNELDFTDEAIVYAIQRYTRESGVRQLKQQLSKIARKFVKKQYIVQNTPNEVIDVADLHKYLSKEIYTHTIKDEISVPGVVNGMAYTEFGGDLLPIEISYYDGKGNILLTGNLKETMKESANVALSYIRSNEEEFKLPEVNWSDLDINLHVPAGGVPKDGPSAGITITTAILSAFLKVPVPCNVAMTGEITLRGKILPIGGLKEKIISAVRGGVDVIFYPKECERLLEDIPKEVLDKITLHPITHYKEVYQKLFLQK